MNIVTANLILGLVTTLLPEGITLVQDIEALIAKHNVPPDQIAAVVALVGQKIQLTAADTIATATADLSKSK